MVTKVSDTSADFRSEESGLTRKSTWPAKTAHNLKCLRLEISAPEPPAKTSQPAAKSRRTLEMRLSSLVAEVQKQQGKHSRQAADELTAKYDLRPTETRAKPLKSTRHA